MSGSTVGSHWHYPQRTQSPPSVLLPDVPAPPNAFPSLLEVGCDSTLSGMTKWGIAHIVSDTCSRYNRRGLRSKERWGFFILSSLPICVPSDRPIQETSRLWVRRLCTKILPGSGNTWVYFAVVEWCREDQSIIVTLEVGTGRLLRLIMLEPKSPVTDESLPVHSIWEHIHYSVVYGKKYFTPAWTLLSSCPPMLPSVGAESHCL